MDFSLNQEKKQYREAATELASSGRFSTIVFGHTHLPKRVPLSVGTYFNTGTWADVMRLPANVAGGADQDIAVCQFVNDMLAKNITPYLHRKLTFLKAMIATDGSVQAELREFIGVAQSRPVHSRCLMAYQDSVGQVFVGNKPAGTVWMITSTLAVTARHCFDDYPEPRQIKVKFGQIEHEVSILEADVALDIALLNFPHGGQLPPNLGLLARPDRASPLVTTDRWSAFGYAPAIVEAENGSALSGTITNPFLEVAGQAVAQLFCEQGGGNEVNFRRAIFGGFSGGPIVAVRDGQEGVVAVILEAPPANAEIVIYSRPIDAVWTRFKEHLDIPVRSWDAKAGRLVICRAANGSLRSNISSNLLAAAWETNLASLWCNAVPDEGGPLALAVARLLLHAKSAGQPSLYFAMDQGWKSAVVSYGKHCITTVNFSAGDQVAKFDWRPLTEPAPVEGYVFANEAALAVYIHRLCDAWTFAQLRDAMIKLWDAHSTIPELHFEIAADIRGKMKPAWTSWVNELKDNPVLLHHFLALLVTERGDHTGDSAGPGAATLKGCLLKGLAFSLAVCSCRPSLLTLKHPTPGNVGTEALAGHICGVGLYRGALLHLYIGEHDWSTIVVTLPNCEHRWESVMVDRHRLDQATDDASIKRDAPRHIVLTGDRALMISLGTGLQAFDLELDRRCSALLELQSSYSNEKSKPR